MNKISKISILVLILALPLAIFIFLKKFGDNRFGIPVYYESGIEIPFEECPGMENAQFYANNLKVKGGEFTNANLFIFFEEDSNLSQNELSNIWSRLQDLFKEKPVEMVTYTMQDLPSVNRGSKLEILSQEEFILKMHCHALTDTVNQFILVDEKARIRGYYDVQLEEVDRLIVETKILLEE